MNREEFVNLIKNQIDSFDLRWKQKQEAEGKRDWPEEMDSLADWLEQFDMYCEDI